MRTELYWVPGPWSGRLAIMPRPRGGDWLEEEIQSWHRYGVDVVVSLLTSDEIDDLNLADEGLLCRANGIDFYSFPVTDRGVPPSHDGFLEFIMKLVEQLVEGKDIAVHCRQGIGRAALVAICVIVSFGISPEAAIQKVSAARGCPVPETPEQRRWITEFVESLANAS